MEFSKDGVRLASEIAVMFRLDNMQKGAAMAEKLSFNGRRRVRKFFGKIPEEKTASITGPITCVM